MGSHNVTCHPAEVTFPPLPQPIKAGTRLIDPERIKGWVGLVGWHEVDGLGLPTIVVAHQLQLECMIEVRRPETDVLPQCYATNYTTTLLLLFIRHISN